MTYGFHPEARLEYLETIDFYESRRTGLGAAFTREVEATIQRILEEPTRWRIIEQDVRRCLTHTFPFGILYTVEEDSILIVAVAHGSREPDYWRRRISAET
jgi:toxin ParE1/3/4